VLQKASEVTGTSIMAMLTTLMHALQQSRDFQNEVLKQLLQPDLDPLCRCCLETVQDKPDLALIMDQLLNKDVQART